MFIQYIYNAVLLGLHFYLIALSFYLGSISCRHFNLAVGGAFLLGPYLALEFLAYSDSMLGAVPVALVIVGGIGFLYHIVSRELFRRGARSVQLLVVSLATLGLIENGLAAAYGSASKTLGSSASANTSMVLLGVRVNEEEAIHLALGGSLAMASYFIWRYSLLGLKVRALTENRAALSLRGHNVEVLEILGSALGFGLAGLSGFFWASTMQIRPSMALEAGVIGVVTFIVRPVLGGGLIGLGIAAIGISVIRLGIVLVAEGEWSMTANLLLLLAALCGSSVWRFLYRSVMLWRGAI